MREQKDMDRALYDCLAIEMRNTGVEELGLFYLGESFMLKWLPEAVAFATNTDGFPCVILATNGSLASPERVTACMEAGLNSLKFSLNYSDAEQYSNVARLKPALFDAVIENFQAARRVHDAGGYDCGIYASYILYDGELLPCWALFTEGHISWVGMISAGCFDHDGRFRMGDLYETSFEEESHSQSFRLLRDTHLIQDVGGTLSESCIAYA